MRKSRFTETQIIGILKAVEAGRLVKDVCREHSVSEATYFQWKSKYGGMEAADVKRLKDLAMSGGQAFLAHADSFHDRRTLLPVLNTFLLFRP